MTSLKCIAPQPLANSRRLVPVRADASGGSHIAETASGPQKLHKLYPLSKRRWTGSSADCELSPQGQSFSAVDPLLLPVIHLFPLILCLRSPTPRAVGDRDIYIPA